MTLARLALRVPVGAFAAVFLLGTSAVQPVKAQTETVLYNFTNESESPSCITVVSRPLHSESLFRAF
jgi:hypothetical protein